MEYNQVSSSQEKGHKLESQYPEAAELTLLNRCGSQLSRVLRGAIVPVQLVFPPGDLTTATTVYQESTVFKVMNTIVEKAIAKALEKLPRARGVRILEIGAGTGATTRYILPQLPPNNTEYVFTNIGDLFTTKAKEKFLDYPFVDYRTLDIEVDLTTQGFESHQYDVIIAANVFHETTSIKEALSHVQQLLAPGGMLVLLEATTPQSWLDLVFGLLEGWWRFQDTELRPDYPLLSRSQWQAVLRETGFTEVVTLPEMEGIPEALSEQSVIVAQADLTLFEQVSLTPKKWLILADSQGIGQKLATQLESKGEVCTLVFAGENYQQLAPQEFSINPDSPQDFEQLIAEVGTQSPALYGVVQCWTTEAGVSKKIEDLSRLGCGSTLSLVQALAQASYLGVWLSQPPRLWLVTAGSQPVPSSHPLIPGVAQSSVWGMGKVIRLEHPELNCMCLDLDPESTIEGQALTLFTEIKSSDIEDQVGLQGDARYVARLVASHHRLDATTEKPLSFRGDASYLITGGMGMGGLGLLVARWMVSKGAKHLVLVGRSSPGETALQKIAELETAGASVVVEIADVSDRELMERVLSNINHSNFPLAGVIHSAGILSDGVLQNQTWSSFEKVMAPKVQGSWYLHELTQHQSLDFFVLFSSAASFFGASGPANHSAANGFIDGLAHYRRAMGLPGLSIHWGAVSQVGEAAKRGADLRGHQQGMEAIAPAQVLESLELLMSGQASTEAKEWDVEVVVVPIEWSAWQERVAKWPFLADWQETIPATTETSKSEFLLKLEATVPSKRCSLVADYLQSKVAQVLGMTVANIDVQQPLNTIGIDSLMALELRNHLKND